MSTGERKKGMHGDVGEEEDRERMRRSLRREGTEGLGSRIEQVEAICRGRRASRCFALRPPQLRPSVSVSLAVLFLCLSSLRFCPARKGRCTKVAADGGERLLLQTRGHASGREQGREREQGIDTTRHIWICRRHQDSGMRAARQGKRAGHGHSEAYLDLKGTEGLGQLRLLQSICGAKNSPVSVFPSSGFRPWACHRPAADSNADQLRELEDRQSSFHWLSSRPSITQKT